jgi:hypothetical protein
MTDRRPWLALLAASVGLLGLFGWLSSAALAAGGQAMEAAGSAAGSRLAPAAPAVEEVFASEGVTALRVRGSIVLWSSADGCTNNGEFVEPCVVRRKPAAGGAARTLYSQLGASGPWLEANPDTDSAGSFYYWANNLGQIVRVPSYATASTTPTLIATKELITATGEVAVNSNYVYWTENITGRGRLFRAPASGGARELMQSYNSPMRGLQADGQGGAFYVSSPLFTNMLIRTRPVSAGVFTSTAASALVDSFALRANTVYWADHIVNDRIMSAPITATSSSTILVADLTGTPTVPTMAANASALFWHEKGAVSGPIQRLNLSGGAPTAITANLSGVSDLGATDLYLFWHTGSAVWRLAADAAAVQLDLRVADLEITQGIQNLTNTVPLVDDRYTLVRVYPGLTNSTVPTKTAMVRLYASRAGSPLLGSPLVRFVEATTSPYQREVFSDTANFVLPAAWTTGTVVFTATITSLDLFDFNPANNNLSLTRTFAPKANLCIKFLPISTWEAAPYWTENLVTGRPTPGFLPILDRLRTLWPTHNILWYTQFTPIRKGAFLGPAGPFTMLNGADRDPLIFALWEHNLYDGAPGWCGGGNARTHYLAMINPSINTGNMGGYAALWDVLSMVKMLTSGSAPFDTPTGGGIAAQELAHNYNGPFGDRWKHIPCNLPAGDDPHDGWPYPGNQLGPNGPRDFFGFDRRTNSVITPTQATDFMGYCDPVWVSDYTWLGLMNATSSPSAASSASPASAAEPLSPQADSVLASGWVTRDEAQAGFGAVHRTAGGLLTWAPLAEHSHAFDPASLGLNLPPTHLHVTGVFALELLSPADAVLASQAVTPTEGTHGGDFTFAGLLPFAPGSAHVRLTRNGAELARRSISAHAPVVAVTAPAGGTVAGGTLDIAWTGSDLDGDPLTYIVQYSADGVNWQAVTSGYAGTTLSLSTTSDLPGSGSALIRVIANDGVNTGSDTSAPFVLLGHAPKAYIPQPEPGRAYLSFEPADLFGEAVDIEDGPLAGSVLQWSVAGPQARSGSGSMLSLFNLAPGTYTATLSATDGDGLAGNTQSTFFVSPKRIYDGAAPTLDGFCDDAAYAVEAEPLVLRHGGLPPSLSPVKFAHASPYTYVCFTGLPIGTNANQMAGIRVDVNNSGGSVLLADDRVFYARRDGVAVTGQGNGTANEVLDAAPNGLQVAVSENNGTWNAELRLDDVRLGGWNHTARMLAGHFAPIIPIANTTWPEGAATGQPGTWGLVTLGRQAQTLSFPSLGTRSLAEAVFVPAAQASSGLPVAFTSTTPAVCETGSGVVTLLATGTCTLVASQGGNGSYFPAASVQQSFVVVTPTVFVPVLMR